MFVHVQHKDLDINDAMVWSFGVKWFGVRGSCPNIGGIVDYHLFILLILVELKYTTV
jgi:hypothetical protein